MENEMESELIKDKRTIRRIHATGDHQTSEYELGRYGVTKIEIYGEPAEYSLIPYCKVFKGEEIAIRLSALNLHVYYSEAA
jgi:hypothetical protein